MTIGVDLDNTLVCYDSSFYEAAGEYFNAPATLAPSKHAVKQFMLQSHGNDEWTRLQGMVYGTLMHRAVPLPGATHFLERCSAAGHKVYVLSHKTQFPVVGDRVDLHACALAWLTAQGWLSPKDSGLTSDGVHFYGTRTEKVRAISEFKCRLFIDDLEEVFSDPSYPVHVQGFLIGSSNPKSSTEGSSPIHVRDWHQITQRLFPEIAA